MSTKYSNSCNAYDIKATLYGRMSQPSNQLDIFLVKVSYIFGYKP